MREMLKNGNQLLEAEQVGELYIKIAGLDGLLTVLKDPGIPSLNLMGKKEEQTPGWGKKHYKWIKENCNRWVTRFQKSLPLYATITDPAVAESVLVLVLTKNAGKDPVTNAFGTILSVYMDLF